METSPGQRWTLALTSAAALMVSLDIQVVTTALPAIRVHLHATLAALEWTVNAYTLAFAVLLLTGAALGERFGRRRMLIAGVALFTAASAGCALSPSAGALVAARAVQGAGSALMMPLALALLSAAFPPRRRAWAIGMFTSVTGLAVLAGPVLGGAVTQAIAWQWVFWLNVPIGLVLMPLIMARIPADARGGAGAGASLDPGGLVLAAGGSFGLVWALIRANGADWGSPGTVATLAASAVLAAAFIAWERRAASPMVPLRLFRARAFAAGNAAALATFGMLVPMVFFMAQLLQVGLGYGPLEAGLRLLPGWATLAVIAPFAGPAVSRLGARPLVTGGLALNGAALAWIAAVARAGLPYGQLVIPLIMAGTGASLAIPAAASAVMGSVPPPAIGKASGVYNTLRQLGGVLGLAVCGAVFAARGGYASAAAFTGGIGPAIGACAGLSIAGAAAGLFLPGRRARFSGYPGPAGQRHDRERGTVVRELTPEP